jgi:hypothetical protein
LSLNKSLPVRGYFPKELPPAFGTCSFAKYAASRGGRQVLTEYHPLDNYTECVLYRLARHGMRQRELRIPHPASFWMLAKLISRNFRRLASLTKVSNLTGCEPIPSKERAIEPRLKPWDLPVSRANVRAGCLFLLKADISEFYPSLYTHAVGWAIDPKSRLRKNWRRATLLGKQIDQALMNWDGKMSQGIPIGNDISFLLAEIVLARVDSELKAKSGRAFRWFDDYEFAFESRDEAELMLRTLTRELGRFRLRINPKKTIIQQLPLPAGEEWQDLIKERAPASSSSPAQMVKYFDSAFRLREKYPETQVLAYALGTLFKLTCPRVDVGRVAESGISQILLLEPGAAQKAFSLLSYWLFHDYKINRKLIIATIERVIDQHEVTGFSNDVAWALAFCLEYELPLGGPASKTLSNCEDDCITLQTLHMRRKGLLAATFSDSTIIRTLQNADLDREHWLLAYESTRHRFSTVCRKRILANPLFSNLLANDVAFYRRTTGKEELILHYGGAPASIADTWNSTTSTFVKRPPKSLAPDAEITPSSPNFGPRNPYQPRHRLKDVFLASSEY